MLSFQWFCSGFRFCCGFPDFLFFWRDLWVILVLCISSLFEKFSLCRFPPFSRNCCSGWLLFCEGTLGSTPRRFNSLGPNPNKRPLTVHPTTLDSSFPPNHTLPTHPRTHPSRPPPHNHTPHTELKNFCSICSPNIPLKETSARSNRCAAFRSANSQP